MREPREPKSSAGFEPGPKPLRPNGIIETTYTGPIGKRWTVRTHRQRGTVDGSTSGRVKLSFGERLFNLAANRLGAAAFPFEQAHLIP